MTLDVRWFDSGIEPTCEPNPDFPLGREVDLAGVKKPTCSTALPYPARRIGHFMVICQECGMTAAITTTGRPDDPCSVRVACRKRRRTH